MLNNSTLLDQDTFYRSFLRDVYSCRSELIIESPFITESRMNILLPVLANICRKNIRVIINTRNPTDHTGDYYDQSLQAVGAMQDLGVEVLYTSGHHRKLAIIDKQIIYEGSLNILSFNDSCEIMRRIVSEEAARQLLKFTGLNRYSKE